jgi:predicted patatin/cPLA2 family phospholipase
MKNGLVLEGGAMRGLFTAGVLDALMRHGVGFDGIVGVSAGAAFGCNLKSRQIGRVLRYNLRFCRDWRYASWRSWWRTGDFFGAEFCYRTLPETLDPFDAAEFARNPTEFHLVCTDIESGEAVYRRCDAADAATMEYMRASASMPLVSRIVEVDGKKLLDGALSDSIPLEYFERLGFARNLVVLTQPEGFAKRPTRALALMKLVYRRYPQLTKLAAKRHEMYNAQLEYVRQAERAGRALVLRPEEKLPIGRVSHDSEAIGNTHRIGVETAEKHLEEIVEFLRREA